MMLQKNTGHIEHWSRQSCCYLMAKGYAKTKSKLLAEKDQIDLPAMEKKEILSWY